VSEAARSETRSTGTPVAGLLRSVASGDRTAFDALYGQFVSPVSRLVRILLRDIAMADEVTQEVFLAVWLGAGRFDPYRGDGRAWILGIARSRAIDRIRSTEATRRRDEHYAIRQREAPVATQDLVQERLDGTILREALWVLTTKQRQALLLAFFDGHSYLEVSELLGIPLPTVKSRIRDGLGRLRRHLGEQIVAPRVPGEATHRTARPRCNPPSGNGARTCAGCRPRTAE
jgi:RNA polymerase sigma-70 factor (ECF subfamily)